MLVRSFQSNSESLKAAVSANDATFCSAPALQSIHHRDGFQLFPTGVGFGQIPLHHDQPGADPHHFVASLLVEAGIGHQLVQAMLFSLQRLDLRG